jgi:hypothetical protein
MAEAARWVRIIHSIAAVPTTLADAPSFDQGETTAKPSPLPNKSSMSASAAATNAPANMAAHDTADDVASNPAEPAATCGCRPIGDEIEDSKVIPPYVE